jgi:CBS domain-containing protein
MVMFVKDIMSTDPMRCTPGTTLREVAEMMAGGDCGEIPVCDEDGKPIGVVTDRDIVCRVLAKGHNPLVLSASQCMTEPVVTASLDLSLEDCARLMEQYRVRRLPVVDAGGICCGIVTQADLARRGPHDITAEVLETVSQPGAAASPGIAR